MDVSNTDGTPQAVLILAFDIISRFAFGVTIVNTAERGDELVDVEVLRLDWQKIATIENLDAFTNLRELYLQHNRYRASKLVAITGCAVLGLLLRMSSDKFLECILCAVELKRPRADARYDFTSCDRS